MASEPGPGPRFNHSTAAAAVDIQSSGASWHQDTREIGVHPVSSPVAPARPVSSEQLNTSGGEQGRISPSQNREYTGTSSLRAGYQCPDLATGTNLGSCTIPLGQYGNPTLTVLLQQTHTDPNHGGHGSTTFQCGNPVPCGCGTQPGQIWPMHTGGLHPASGNPGAVGHTHMHGEYINPQSIGYQPIAQPAPPSGPANVHTSHFSAGPHQTVSQSRNGIEKRQNGSMPC